MSGSMTGSQVVSLETAPVVMYVQSTSYMEEYIIGQRLGRTKADRRITGPATCINIKRLSFLFVSDSN